MKPKAREKLSRYLDVMADLENKDILLGSCSRNEEANGKNDSDTNLGSESNRLQRNSNLVKKKTSGLYSIQIVERYKR